MADGIELASAYVTIIPSLKGATKTIEQQLGGVDTSKAGRSIGGGLSDSIADSIDLSAIGTKLEGGGRQLNDYGDKLMGVGGALTAGITAPMAAAVAAVGGFALSTASAAETTEISFTTMLGSAEAAEQMMGDLADFAAHTPFELSGLQTATRQLLAYGFTAEDVIPMLTSVGDATAALGTGQAGIESVTRALGQMQTRGKVSAEEMLQLTEAGIPAWEYLAEAIGTDTAGAMQAVTDGAVSASEGIEAITSGMERDFGGMMESQSKTVAGLMSNLADAIQQPLMELRDTDAYEHFADALSDVVDEAGPLVESVMPLMEDGLDSVAGLLETGADAMEDFASMSEGQKKDLLGMAAGAAAAGPALTVVGGALRVIGTVGGAAGTVISKAAEGIGNMQRKAGPAASAADAVSKSTEALGTSAAGATTSTGLLSKGLGVLGTVAKGAGIMALVTAVGTLAAKLYEGYQHAELVSGATRDFGDVMGQAGESVSNVELDVEGLLTDMSALADSAADTMSEFQADSAMLDQYTDSIERLAGQSDLTAQEQHELKAAVDGYNDITGDSIEVTDAANGKLDESTDYILKNADAWKQNAEAQALQEIAADYLEQQYRASQDLKVAQEQLAEAQQRVADTQGDIFANTEAVKAYDEAKQNVEDLSEAYDTAKRNAEDFGNSAAVAASDLRDSVKDAVKGLPADMQGVGLDIATSLSDGISKGNVKTKGAARFIADGVGGVVASMPPDMQDRGLQVASALADGISSGKLTVNQAMDILNAAATGKVSTLPPKLRGYGANAAQMLGTGMSSNKGKVSSGAGALDSAARSSVSGLPAFARGVGSNAAGRMASGMEGSEWKVSSAASGIASAASAMDDIGNMYQSGYNQGANYAAGLRAAKSAVSEGALMLAEAAASALHHSTPDVGPLKDDDEWGYEQGRNYADALVRSVPLVSSASAAVAEAAGIDAGWASGARPMASYRAAGGGQRNITNNISIDGSALDASPQIAAAFEAFVSALNTRYDMGVA